MAKVELRLYFSPFLPAPMSTDVTQMLLRWSEGDPEALDRLLPLVYDQLKRLAHARLRGERDGHTLNTTALVHEAYVRLVDIERVQWTDRAHFLAMASRQMRRILIDYARRRNREKRQGRQVELDEERLIPDDYADTLLELDDALARFERDHPRQARAVELHYFGGLTLDEAAAVLGVGTPTVWRDLRYARAWLAHLWKGELDRPE
jgi:RNA polymerase sigma factor (TIGR02999 family)